MASPFPCCPVNRECLKENSDRKKKTTVGKLLLDYLCMHIIHVLFYVHMYLSFLEMLTESIEIIKGRNRKRRFKGHVLE